MSEGSPPVILVIDDEENLRQSVCGFLEDYSYAVLEAENGRFGLEVFERERPDLVLVDLRMPEVDGLEVIKKISKISPDTPLIVVSGTGVIRDAVEALHLGAWDYLLKPIEDMSVLLHAVRAGLERARLILENRQHQQHLEEQVAARTVELRMANEELEQINARLRQIVGSTRSLSLCTEVEQFGSRLLEEFGQHMMAAGGSLYLKEDDGLRLVHTLDPGHAPVFLPFPLRVGSLFAQVLDRGSPMLIQDIESQARTSSSGWSGYRDGSLLLFPLPNEQGEIVGVLSLHSKTDPPFVRQDREIGEILASYSSEALRATRSAAALAESEERYRLLAENVSDNIWIFDLISRRLSYCSPSIERITGYTPEETQFLSIDEIFSPQSTKTIAAIAEEEFAKEDDPGADPGRTRELELEQRHKSGDYVWVEVKGRFLRDETGAPIGVLGVTRDISERKELEARFLQSQKMETVGRLAGGVAHDFNNLLSPILGYTELLLLDLSPDDPRHDDLLEIQRAAHRAKDLTRQLLAFGRKQVLEMKTVDLGHVVTGFEKILRRTIREDIDLRIRRASTLGTVRADVSQIELILMNLVVNAQDAMPDGGKMIIETTDAPIDEAYAEEHSGVRPGPYSVLVVSDTGIGMDEETQKNVFEPFFTTKKKGEGTGLGLATVYGIVTQHGGYIWVYSEPGKGTTFKIHFPRVDGRVDRPVVPARRDSSAGGNECIMVMEDSDTVRNLVSSILKKHGYRVIESGDPEECLRFIEQHRSGVDLLLTDVVMPQMNGRELYEQLHPLVPELRVLYMSGYADDVIAHHGILDEGVDFIQKPISVQTLTTKIREVLDR